MRLELRRSERDRKTASCGGERSAKFDYDRVSPGVSGFPRPS
jgi:hypothetical protein